MEQGGIVKVSYRNFGPFIREKHVIHKLVNGVFFGIVCQLKL